MALVRSELLRTVREVFADPQDIVATTAPGRIGVLHRLRADRATASLVADCRRVADVIAAQNSLTARAGIGEPADSVGALHDSYQDACDALRLTARRTGGPAGRPGAGGAGAPVHLIAELRIHQVLAAVGQPARGRLLATTAAELRAQPDWPVLRDTVTAWCEGGFNLVRAAEALHVHRNTVVYRMQKIERLTGRPLRDHRATMALYLACLSDELGGAPETPARPKEIAVDLPPRPRRTS